MNLKNKNKASNNIFTLSVSFLLLTIALECLLGGYWWIILEPRLKQEANTHAQVIANSQATSLAKILSANYPGNIEKDLNNELDQILLFTEPTSKVTLFKSIAIKLDYGVIKAKTGSLDFIRAEDECQNCIELDNALYSKANDELLGIVKFKLNKEIFLRLKSDLEYMLFIEALLVFILLFFTWFITLNLINRLNRQRETRKEAEIALWKNERKYHRLVNNLNKYFTYIKNTAGEIVHVSDSVEKVIGYSNAEINQVFNKYCTGSIKDHARVQKTEFGDEQFCYDVEIKAPDGDIHNIQLSEITVRDNNNHIIEYEGIAHDVTDQKLYEKQLSESKEQAELANRIKSQFLANMSHEIRTPLNGIIGMGQILSKSKLSDKQHLQLQKIKSSADLLLTLVNEILDYSKVESGLMELDKINFKLQSIVDNIHELLVDKATEKNIQLECTIDSVIPEILTGDPLRLSQILMNLTNNAIKFTEQGSVTIDVGLENKDEQSFTLIFSVKDTGIGISSQGMSKLFKAFSQVDSSMTRRYGGTGLGLAICKNLSNLMNGKIWVESEPDKGSTFFFTARFEQSVFKQETSINMTQKNSFESLPFNNIKNSIIAENNYLLPKILLVEDNDINQEVALDILEDINAEIIVANNGLEAVEKVQQESFSLILMDLQMPVMDGFEATKLIKSMPAYADLPIIAMTAYAMQGDRESCLAHGMDDYLSKPINIDVCIKMVNKWIYRDSIYSQSPEEEQSQEQSKPDIDIPGIDIELAMMRLKGKKEFLKKLLIRFVDTRGSSIEDIQICLDTNNLEEAGRLIHRLKGMAGNLSAIPLENSCISLEHALKEDNMELVKELLPQMHSQIAQLEASARQLQVSPT